MPDKSEPLPQGPDRWEKQMILFCGHLGFFYGDVIITPSAVTILNVGKGKRRDVTPGGLYRTGLHNVQWHITDTHGGYWGDRKGGVFVLPRKSLTKITPDNIKEFIS